MFHPTKMYLECYEPTQFAQPESSRNSFEVNKPSFTDYSQRDFGMPLPISENYYPIVGDSEAYLTPPPVNLLCHQLYVDNESDFANQHMMVPQHQALVYELQCLESNYQMDLSGYCLCDLNTNQPKQQMLCCSSQNSTSKASSTAKKPRCIPKNESDSVTLKGYRFKFKFENTCGRKKKIIQCQYDGCSKEFTKTWSFLYHARMHEGETPFECDVCHRKFSQKSNLTKHKKHHVLKTITQRKQFKCSLCPKAYTERYNLRKHLKAGHGINADRNLTVFTRE
ncbi:unnamed protein product [Moneuplotes crassus]|uniref:C2H2-type domain-containing protein n=1 Tax=Euplotes crassus TaxID=5936 RepID=A0AAD2D9D0_EUPCR|nr:unnamed protein product [Moneuplotes crassus]